MDDYQYVMLTVFAAADAEDADETAELEVGADALADDDGLADADPAVVDGAETEPAAALDEFEVEDEEPQAARARAATMTLAILAVRRRRPPIDWLAARCTGPYVLVISVRFH